MAIYYWVEPKSDLNQLSFEEKEIVINGKTETLRFFWVPLADFDWKQLTFPIDQFVARNLFENK
jgi:hypothetical protein